MEGKGKDVKRTSVCSNGNYVANINGVTHSQIAAFYGEAVGKRSRPVGSGEDSTHSVTPKRRKIDDHKNEGLGIRGFQWTEVVSSEPKASIVHNFLSKEECEYLINFARPHLTRALVSGGTVSSSRTSHGKFLTRGGDKVISAIEKRIADFTHIPLKNGEGMQVLRYKVGEKHDPHFDYSDNNCTSWNGGPRKATLVMYLSDVEEGGETIFPKAKRIGSDKAGPNGMWKWAKEGVSVKPQMGDALLFWSMRNDKTLDPLSLHGSNPVIRGEKWICTKWMHESEYKYK